MNLQHLHEFCMCPAPLGDEARAKALIRSWMPTGFEAAEDAAGSLIMRRPGKKPGLMLMASLSQPTVVVTGHRADGSWQMQPLGAPKDLEALDGWAVCSNGGASAILEVSEETLRLKDAGGVAAGDLLTRRPRWTMDDAAVSCDGLADRIGCWVLTELMALPIAGDCEISFVFIAQEALNTKTAELAAYQMNPVVAIRVGTAPVQNARLTGAPVDAGKGPVIKLRERYASTDGRLVELFRQTAEEKQIPCQYELLEMSVTGLYTAQYAHCGVVIGGIDIPEERGCIQCSDLRHTLDLLHSFMNSRDEHVSIFSTGVPGR